LITDQPTRELVAMARDKAVVLTLGGEVTTLPDHGSFEKVEQTGANEITISYNKDRANAGDVLAAAQAAGLTIVDVSTREADLEDVFLNLTRAA
jgi:ABC-2 type transport system ATP-binding protein